ncbi:MAG TPA: zf-HC2 domain-containing protein [Pyrinomonadaceae bacterium]
MNEKKQATTHGVCERGEELVAYLYGEATKEEAGLFRNHLEACAVCREELAALGGVREGLAAWRAEALGTVPSLNIEEALAPAAPVLTDAPRKRSARAALREFFSLSPLWLRAGAFAAVLAFCALLVLTLARSGGPEKVVEKRVEVPVQSGYTEEQVNAVVARKVAEARAQLAAEMKEREDDRRPEQVVNFTARDKTPQPAPTRNAARRTRPSKRSSNGDDNLLADDNLPRLSDLLSGSY